jgi:carboxymethylenebutenolidase
VCFDHDSLPPIAVVAGAAVSHEELELVAADGNRLAAFLAEPDDPKGIGVVILPDIRGLYRFYEELALRFAERGYHAIAIDYFGRTAGARKRGEDFEYGPHVQQTTHHGVQSDIGAGVERLRDSCHSIFTVGFCYGGRQSWLAAASGHGLKGAVGFYGRPLEGRPEDSPDPATVAADMRAPILGLMGGADEGIPASAVEAFDQALSAARVEHELVTYDGAPHSFFDRKYEEFAEDSEDAWRRTLAFMERYAKDGAPGG